MDCLDAGERLVALQDGELAPSEARQVEEHLAGCPACADRERRLAAATPSGRLAVPPAVRALLEDRVDADVILALAERGTARAPTPRPRWGGWLRRETRVPAPAVVAYAALLALALGWGLSNWWTLSALRAAPSTAATDVLPADAFAPAAYDPLRGGGRGAEAPPARLSGPHGSAPGGPADVDGGLAGEAEDGGFH